MLDFNLSKFRRLRVWFDDLNDTKLSDKILVKKIKCGNEATVFSKNKIIIELMIPRGGHILYGLLGIEYTQQPTDELVIMISRSSKHHEKIFKDSLLAKHHKIYVGLTEELRESIKLEIDNEIEKTQIHGNINFCYCAYSEVYSSGYIFRIITKLLLRILTNYSQEFNAESLEKTLNELIVFP